MRLRNGHCSGRHRLVRSLHLSAIKTVCPAAPRSPRALGGVPVPTDAVGLHVSVLLTVSESNDFSMSLAHDIGYALL